MRIGFDIDGVLANFDVAYERMFVELTGRNDFAPYDIKEGPRSWNWPTEHFGYTKEETTAVWEHIKADPTFWFHLPPQPGFDLFKIWHQFNHEAHDVYFITSRPGIDAKWQTEEWFFQYLGYTPTVLISDRKGLVCAALNIDYYVDDRAENIVDVVRHSSPHTKAYLLDKAYNRHMNPGGVRIANLEEFLHIITSVR